LKSAISRLSALPFDDNADDRTWHSFTSVPMMPLPNGSSIIMRSRLDIAPNANHLFLHGIADHRECLRADLVLRRELVGRIAIAIVDRGLRHEPLDLNGMRALDVSPRLPTSRAGSAYLGLADVGLAPRGPAVAVGPHRGGGLQRAVSSLFGSSTLDVETVPRRRRNSFTRVSHEPGTIPAMIAETNTHDRKASEDAEAFHLLRSIEATLDDIARELAEMKAEARQFLTAQELSR